MVVSTVLQDLLLEGLQLLLGRQLSMHEKERSLEEGRSTGELLNWVATVLENTLLSVDEGDARDAVDSVHVGWIVGASDSAGWALDLGQVGGVDCAVLDWQLVSFA